jgi:hypothetical protein
MVKTGIETQTKKNNEINKEPKSQDEIMANEVVQVWNMFLKDGGAGKNDERRKDFNEFASYVVRAIRYYQNVAVDIHGRNVFLPLDPNLHILVAVLITKESSIIPTAVGSAPRFEVGLMQVWGVALNGYDKEVVKRDTELGVRLGVRWLTYMLAQCKPYRTASDYRKWTTTDWLGPLTMYGSKPSKVWIDRKNKTCRVFPFARERVKLVFSYRNRIRNVL